MEPRVKEEIHGALDHLNRALEDIHSELLDHVTGKLDPEEENQKYVCVAETN